MVPFYANEGHNWQMVHGKKTNTGFSGGKFALLRVTVKIPQMCFPLQSIVASTAKLVASDSFKSSTTTNKHCMFI